MQPVVAVLQRDRDEVPIAPSVLQSPVTWVRWRRERRRQLAPVTLAFPAAEPTLEAFYAGDMFRAWVRWEVAVERGRWLGGPPAIDDDELFVSWLIYTVRPENRAMLEAIAQHAFPGGGVLAAPAFALGIALVRAFSTYAPVSRSTSPRSGGSSQPRRSRGRSTTRAGRRRTPRSTRCGSEQVRSPVASWTEPYASTVRSSTPGRSLKG